MVRAPRQFGAALTDMDGLLEGRVGVFLDEDQRLVDGHDALQRIQNIRIDDVIEDEIAVGHVANIATRGQQREDRVEPRRFGQNGAARGFIFDQRPQRGDGVRVQVPAERVVGVGGRKGDEIPRSFRGRAVRETPDPNQVGGERQVAVEAGQRDIAKFAEIWEVFAQVTPTGRSA
ncbi:MAG: hypothetical protein IPK17_00640 [Chloroflexi bacterium]|uniref:hypothetical protein n=1 Tax=Candidatus Flexifilum breve TaxID=3140694 RepID=UPI0031360221|nr:hypothetical protein [Chloroflexota bacterium]